MAFEIKFLLVISVVCRRFRRAMFISITFKWGISNYIKTTLSSRKRGKTKRWSWTGSNLCRFITCSFHLTSFWVIAVYLIISLYLVKFSHEQFCSLTFLLLIPSEQIHNHPWWKFLHLLLLQYQIFPLNFDAWNLKSLLVHNRLIWFSVFSSYSQRKEFILWKITTFSRFFWKQEQTRRSSKPL